jgi:hypothetical protein
MQKWQIRFREHGDPHEVGAHQCIRVKGRREESHDSGKELHSWLPVADGNQQKLEVLDSQAYAHLSSGHRDGHANRDAHETKP